MLEITIKLKEYKVSNKNVRMLNSNISLKYNCHSFLLQLYTFWSRKFV